MKRCFFTTLFSIIVCSTAFAQNVYFVDGYHGGIYGHYPVEWKTQFIVDQLSEHPEWKVCIEIEPETWDTVRLRTPEAYEAFQKIAADKRVEFTNPTWAQPYCYNVSGESIIRQFDYGIKHINEHFPEVEFTTYSVEEPCFTSSLPQILNSFGFKYAVLKCPNTCWGGYMAAHGGELVNWVGPDGSSILTVPRYACEELEQNSTWQTTAWGNSDEYIKACIDYGIEHPVGMCFQDAGWKYGPWIGSGDNIRNNSTYVTWNEYFEEISNGATQDDYRMSQEDVLVELMWGSQVLQRIGQQVHRSENVIVMAEKMGVLANLDNGYRYEQSELDEAWRTLMLAQHHDSWIVPYNRLKKQRTWADEIALWTANTDDISEAVIDSALKSFAVSNDSGAGYVRVFNTLGVARNEVVSVALPAQYSGLNVTVRDINGVKVDSYTEGTGEGLKLTFKADVPAFGYATYRIESGKAVKNKKHKVKTISKGDYVFENDMYRIVFDTKKGGTIKSLIAKKEGGKEFVDQTSQYALGELRGYFYDDGKFYSSADNPAKITIVKSNGLETILRVDGEIASHPFTQIITLEQGQERIDFDLTVDWQNNVGIGEYRQLPKDSRGSRRAFSDNRFKLNVLFPVNLEAPRLSKDAPFDVCESRLESTEFNSWDSIKHNIILNWVSLAEEGSDGHGVALFSDHTTSYCYSEDYPLGLTLQYSGSGLWGVDYKITGPSNVKYAIVPHSGMWDSAAVYTDNNSWNEPLVAAFVQDAPMTERSFIDMDDTGYQISAAHLTDGGVLLRLFNSEGDDSPQSVKLGFDVTSVDEISLSGEIIESVEVADDVISVAMPRFGIKTFIINI